MGLESIFKLIVDLFTAQSNLILLYSIGDSRSSKCILRQDQIFGRMHLYGDIVENSVSLNVSKTNGFTSQCMLKVPNPLNSYYPIFVFFSETA